MANKTPSLAPSLDNIDAAMADIGRQLVAPKAAEWRASKDYPREIWQALATVGAFGIGAPRESGGLGGGYTEIGRAAGLLSRHGGVPGITTTWLGHVMSVRLQIIGSAPAALRAALLPEFAAGRQSMAIAISEPGAGAHPKHLKTRAERDGDDFIINGEKAYLTNGPLAKFFLVLAITSETEGRKAFSAFLVPEDTPGLQRTPGIKIDFLRPAPHCGIILQDCRVPASHMFGTEGEAFQTISLSMRAVEDAVGASSFSGSAGFLIDHLPALLSPQLVAAKQDLLEDLAHLRVMPYGLSTLAVALCAKLDDGGADAENLLELTLAFRLQARAFLAAYEGFLQKYEIEATQSLTSLLRDLTKTFDIAKAAIDAKLRKIGSTLLN